MVFRKHKWIAVVLAVVCVAVQALVIIPHHHHVESEAPCFNFVHCIEHSQEHAEEHQGCCHDHCAPEQAPASEHECYVKVDIAEVVSEQVYRAIISEISIINDFFAPEAAVSAEQINTLHSFTLTRWRQMPVVMDKCVIFIMEAHSPRAPSLSV